MTGVQPELHRLGPPRSIPVFPVVGCPIEDVAITSLTTAAFLPVLFAMRPSGCPEATTTTGERRQ
jgi:hypothetical protein